MKLAKIAEVNQRQVFDHVTLINITKPWKVTINKALNYRRNTDQDKDDKV